MLNNIIIKSDYSSIQKITEVRESSIINEDIFFCNIDKFVQSINQEVETFDLDEVMKKSNFTNSSLIKLVKIYIHNNIENINPYVTTDQSSNHYYNLYTIINNDIAKDLKDKNIKIKHSADFTSQFIVYSVVHELIKDRYKQNFKYVDYKADNLEHSLELNILYYLLDQKEQDVVSFDGIYKKIIDKYDNKLQDIINSSNAKSEKQVVTNNTTTPKKNKRNTWKYVFGLLGLGSCGAAAIAQNNKNKSKNKKKTGKKVTVKLKKSNPNGK